MIRIKRHGLRGTILQAVLATNFNFSEQFEGRNGIRCIPSQA